MAKHAYLAASASHRWLHCPPSAKLCAQVEDETSVYAKEGSDAHALCEYLLKDALNWGDAKNPIEDLDFYNTEMQEAAEGYVTFVIDKMAEIQSTPMVFIEQVLDFSKWVPHGFGTADCVIIADGVLHIIDFKYGTGVLVSPDGNTQLMCYALGALDTFSDLYEVSTVRLSIYQPRRANAGTYEMSASDLLSWADETLAPIAKLAFAGEGDFAPGEHCQFCKVEATCRARADYGMELAAYDFADPPTLSTEEIARILPKAEQLAAWANDVKGYALQQALDGEHFPGYKLVEGRSVRKYTDPAAVASVVANAGYEPYEQKLLGITEMTKQLGKKTFNELLGSLVDKPPGKPVLVPESDKRTEYSPAASDFANE